MLLEAGQPQAARFDHTNVPSLTHCAGRGPVGWPVGAAVAVDVAVVGLVDPLVGFVLVVGVDELVGLAEGVELGEAVGLAEAVDVVGAAGVGDAWFNGTNSASTK